MKRFTEKFKKLFAVVKKKTTELLIRSFTGKLSTYYITQRNAIAI